MNRCRHIVSTFWLGIALAEQLGINLKAEDENDISLLYLWFLSCLYHDVGYIYEQDTEMQIPHMNVRPLEDMKDNICEVEKYLKDTFNIEHIAENEFVPYNKGTIYFYLIRKFQEGFSLKFDVSGQKYFLLYSTKHFPVYVEAANAVIIHNIWEKALTQYLMDPDNTKKKCYVRINIKNKLHFLLSLADTLEPLKRFQKSADVLDKIYLGSSREGQGISIQVTDPEVWEECYKDIFDDGGINSWMDVEAVPYPHENYAVELWVKNK